MKIFITGGTGFVGHEVIRQLLAAGHTVRALVRPGSGKKLGEFPDIETWSGDATCPDTLEGAMDGCDGVIHLVGIIREFWGKGITFERLHSEATRNVVDAAEAQGVRRYLQMSANGTRDNAATPYHKTKWKAEEYVRQSSLDWTIFRPSIIVGPGGEFTKMLGTMVRRMPVVPVVGNGQYKMAPVSVEDVAAGFVRALGLNDTIGQTYACCGPDELSYDEILDRVGEVLGKAKVRKLHQPLALMAMATSLLQAVPQYPLTLCQLNLLLEGNVCSSSEWKEAFGIEPQRFTDMLEHCL